VRQHLPETQKQKLLESTLNFNQMKDHQLEQMTEDELLEWFAECEEKASELEITLDYYFAEFV
jgi:hypothetical protein